MVWGLTRIAAPRGPLRAAPLLRGEYTGFALGLPMVGAKILHRDQRDRQPKGYTSHEVTAPRAVGPSGRTKLLRDLQHILTRRCNRHRPFRNLPSDLIKIPCQLRI